MNSFTAKLQQARQNLPLKGLMERRGRGPSNGNWKTFPKCPYCEGDNCAGTFTGTYGELFKCHRTSCRSGTAEDHAAFDEIGFLAFELGINHREATRTWLQEAGLWEENTRLPVATTDSEKGDLPIGSPEVVTKTPLEAIVERGNLVENDRQELKVKRGLSDEMITGAGFLTNDRSNLPILESLVLEYPEWELAKYGVYKRVGKGYKSSGQFYGFGNMGKKKRLPAEVLETGDYDDLDNDDFVWAHKESGLCNPILIPYYDLSRKLIGLRPHKGFPKGQHPQLYLTGGKLAVQKCDRAVIVEGEFKGCALQDIVGNNWAVASVPGITQVKNMHVWAGILDWLKRIGARTVVVVFDNEEHGDPKLSSFRTQMEDRFESEIWVRVCAIRLSEEGYDARVGHLPDDWRNANGKADWDSALAAMLQAGKSRPEIRALFEQVLQTAIRIHDLRRIKLFGPAEEHIIQDRVELRTYQPALPWGGPAEKKIAGELRKLATGKLRELAGRIIPLAEAYEATFGWYYELRISEQHKEKLLFETS